jgi:hypothetical protein
MTPNEVMDSLTGFDEIAIEQAFGKNIDVMSKNPSLQVRALAAVQHHRASPDGKFKDAYTHVMNLTQVDVMALFDDDAEAGLEDSEVGKESLQPTTELQTSPPSASTPESSPASTTP